MSKALKRFEMVIEGYCDGNETAPMVLLSRHGGNAELRDSQIELKLFKVDLKLYFDLLEYVGVHTYIHMCI